MTRKKVDKPELLDPEVLRLEREIADLKLQKSRFQSYSVGHSSKFKTKAFAMIDADIASKQEELDQLLSDQPAA